MMNTNYEDNDQGLQSLPRASITKAPLEDSRIEQNATSIARIFQSINFTVNSSQYHVSAPKAKICFQFTNGSTSIFDMQKIAGTTDNFTYTYRPGAQAPIGNHTVYFKIYNESQDGTEQINTELTKRYFLILANSISYLNKIELYRGESLSAEITILNSSNRIWTVSIVDAGLTLIRDMGKNTLTFTTLLDTSFAVNAYYYVKVEVTSKIDSSLTCTEYYRFRVLNRGPLINTNSIVFTPTSVYRGKNCYFSVNISDTEDTFAQISASIVLEDPKGEQSVSLSLKNNGDGLFYRSLVINTTDPIGRYLVYITAVDTKGATDTYTTNITVLNNPPVINSFTINTKGINQSIAILYGENLIFRFNLTDYEGISYVEVDLRDHNGAWYKTIADYKADLTITIRTVDLDAGVWQVYVYVIDTDGEKVGLADGVFAGPQEIVIIADVMALSSPWIILGLGLAVGLAIGLAAGYNLLKRKMLMNPNLYKASGTPQKEISKPTQVKKQITPKSAPSVESKPPEQKELVPKDPEKKDDTIKKTKEAPKQGPQRRIKRKLK